MICMSVCQKHRLLVIQGLKIFPGLCIQKKVEDELVQRTEGEKTGERMQLLCNASPLCSMMSEKLQATHHAVNQCKV